MIQQGARVLEGPAFVASICTSVYVRPLARGVRSLSPIPSLAALLAFSHRTDQTISSSYGEPLDPDIQARTEDTPL